MPLSGRARWRAIRLPLLPRLTIAGIVLSIGALLAGIFVDHDPPPPVGELLPATVAAVEPNVLVVVDAPDGQVICGVDQEAFPDAEAPPRGTRITVDYTPAACTVPAVSEEWPTWVFFTVGGVGSVLVVTYLWFARPITYHRFVDAWVRGYLFRP